MHLVLIETETCDLKMRDAPPKQVVGEELLLGGNLLDFKTTFNAYSVHQFSVLGRLGTPAKISSLLSCETWPSGLEGALGALRGNRRQHWGLCPATHGKRRAFKKALKKAFKKTLIEITAVSKSQALLIITKC